MFRLLPLFVIALLLTVAGCSQPAGEDSLVVVTRQYAEKQRELERLGNQLYQLRSYTPQLNQLPDQLKRVPDMATVAAEASHHKTAFTRFQNRVLAIRPQVRPTDIIFQPKITQTVPAPQSPPPQTAPTPQSPPPQPIVVLPPSFTQMSQGSQSQAAPSNLFLPDLQIEAGNLLSQAMPQIDAFLDNATWPLQNVESRLQSLTESSEIAYIATLSPNAGTRSVPLYTQSSGGAYPSSFGVPGRSSFGRARPYFTKVIDILNKVNTASVPGDLPSREQWDIAAAEFDEFPKRVEANLNQAKVLSAITITKQLLDNHI